MKVLFITSTRLGDAILSTGAVDYLLKKYPQAKITVACGFLPQSMFEGFPNVERIIPMRKEKYHGHWFKLWKQVAGTRWDMVIDLRDSIVSRALWAGKRHIFSKHIDKDKHKVEQTAQVIGVSDALSPKLYFTSRQQDFAKDLIPKGTPVLGVGPSANWIGKTWPAERFIELVQWMTSAEGILPNARVAVFAAPGEENQALPVLNSVTEGRRIDGIAKGNPAEIAAALARCDFYVGNDSGLMHAAAAAGVPTVGVFGPSYPHIYRPWGAHAVYAQTPETFDQLIDFAGYNAKTLNQTLMESLSVDAVKKVIAGFWEDRKSF